VGLLIGPGGSKQRELVAASGGDVKISIRGKGSNSKESSLPGMAEVSLVVIRLGTLVLFICRLCFVLFSLFESGNEG
jgi:hypothetical protein